MRSITRELLCLGLENEPDGIRYSDYESMMTVNETGAVDFLDHLTELNDACTPKAC